MWPHRKGRLLGLNRNESVSKRGYLGSQDVIHAATERYHDGMPHFDFRESTAPGDEDDVEPMFPEPLVELDLDD